MKPIEFQYQEHIEDSESLNRFRKHLFQIAGQSSAASLKLRNAPGVEALTPQENRIVILICDAYESKEIATILGTSVRTIESHRRNIGIKLGFDSPLLLQRWAIRKGLIPL